MKFHNQNGIKNPSSKLTWRIVEEIRNEYKNGYSTYDSLAEKYNVSTSTIGRLLRRETWIQPGRNRRVG